MTAATSRSEGLVACDFCDTLAVLPATRHPRLRCPRCGSRIHQRIPHSIEKTWALLIAAFILYIPANLLPVMTVVYFGKGEPSTIMGGVIHLIEGGMWPLALVVFVASIFVPVLKLLVLSLLLISIHLKSRWRAADRTRLYRLTEFVGRWSMVDIFVIAILAALVQFGALASIQPGAGAVAFAAVVVLTMLAAHSFDPRLIWDAMEQNDV